MSDDEGYARHGRGQHQGPAKTAPYPMTRLSPPHDLVDTARQIQQADLILGAVVSNKLRLIADQIRGLKEQAQAILEEARRDAELHRAACNFKKRAGAVYHLYRREGGGSYFSMLSPEEWNGQPPDAFAGSFRLELDMSWTLLG
jgi:hypothetical protein